MGTARATTLQEEADGDAVTEEAAAPPDVSVRPGPPTPATPATLRGRPARRLPALVRSALLRASRTFLQSFLAVLTAGPILDLNVSTVKAGGAAGIAAVLALVQRSLDETPVPTIPLG